MIKKRSIIPLAAILVSAVINGKINASVTPPDSASNANSVFCQKWYRGQQNDCAKMFSNSAKVSFADAKQKLESVAGRVLDTTGDEGWNTQSSQWIYERWIHWYVRPDSSNDQYQYGKFMATRDRITWVTENGQWLIVNYTSEDVTQQVADRFEQFSVKQEKIFHDTSSPEVDRVMAGISLYINLCQVCAYERMWPVLQTLMDFGIAKHPKEFGIIQEATRHAVKNCPPPETAKVLVQSVLGAKK